VGLFDKKKEVPRLPRPEMKEGGFSLPDFPSANEFPQYDSSMKNDMGSIKKAINQPQKQQVMPRMMPPMEHIEHHHHPHEETPVAHEKTLFVRVPNYEHVVDAVDHIKDRISDVESVLSNLEHLKNQEDHALSEWHKNLGMIKQKLLSAESKLFRV